MGKTQYNVTVSKMEIVQKESSQTVNTHVKGVINMRYYLYRIYMVLILIQKKLKRLLKKKKIDKLVVLGDLYYAGPSYNKKYKIDSMNVKDILTKYSDKIICLRGNCDPLQVNGL